MTCVAALLGPHEKQCITHNHMPADSLAAWCARLGLKLARLRAERFKRLHPEVAVHLQVENTRRCCGAVARGEADLALVGGVMPPDLEHLLQARARTGCG